MKLHIASVLTMVINDDDRKIITLLKAMTIFSTGGPSDVLIAEIIKVNDRRRLSEQFDEARVKEIDGLLRRVAFEIVMEDVVRKSNIMGGQFVLAIKKQRNGR